MALTKPQVLAAVKDDLMPAFMRERDSLERIDRWARWHHEPLRIPTQTTPELRQLRDLAKTPWLGLIVDTLTQSLFVDGYRGESEATTTGPWATWQANDFDNRQIAVHRSAFQFGTSYVTVLPGTDPTGKPRSVLRGVSRRRMFARYCDPAADDWPETAMKVHYQPDGSVALTVYDDAFAHYLTSDRTGGGLEYVGFDEHGAGVCPVVRYANMLDLDGRAVGEVEPFIDLAARIDKTIFDRLMTQHYASWKVRTVAGMAIPDTEEQQNASLLKLRQDDILWAEDPDTKFGTLDASSLEPFIGAAKSDIQALAAASQTPTHNLTGDMVNLSAEALAAARASLTQKVYERQKSFGKSHAQTLRLAATLEGNTAAAADFTARVSWQDMSVRSLSQAVDAYGKAAQMLGVPEQALWRFIPGVEQADLDEWRKLAEQDNPVTQLQAALLKDVRWGDTTTVDQKGGAGQSVAGMAPPPPPGS